MRATKLVISRTSILRIDSTVKLSTLRRIRGDMLEVYKILTNKIVE